MVSLLSLTGFATSLAIARNHLRFGVRAGKTVVLACRAELPLIIQRPIRGPSGQAIVALLTPAGALFDGDAACLDVECEAGTDVTLTTAAATKLNRCDTSAISFSMRVVIADHAEFRYLPHELIPLQGARYQQRIEVSADPAARATLLEVIGPGASAAQFSFASLEFATIVRVGEEIAAREQFVLTPRSKAQLGGYSHYGSMLRAGGSAPGLCVTTSSDASQFGVSELPRSGIAAKMLGRSAQVVRTSLLGALPEAGWLQPLLPP